MASGSKKLLILVILAVVVLGGGGFIMLNLFNRPDFDLEKIRLVIEAPTSVASSEDFVVRVLYANDNKVSLSNTSLVFDKPDSFDFAKGGLGEYMKSSSVSLGSLEPGETGEVKVRGALIAALDSQNNFKFHLKFSPGGLNTELEKVQEAIITISSVPIETSIEAPATAVNGYPMEYRVSIINKTSTDFKKVGVFALYPKNFNFISADPVPVLGDNGTWSIETLKGSEKKILSIKGVLMGEKDEIKDITVSVGLMTVKGSVKYSEGKSSSRLILPPIDLLAVVNGSTFYNANPGEELEVVFRYKNNSATDFSDLRIENKIAADVLDFATMSVENGIYDEIPNPASATRASMSWDSNTLSSLASLTVGEEKEVRYRIKVKDTLPIKDSNSKNFEIKNSVKVFAKSADEKESREITSNEFETKLSSHLILNVKAYYNDDGRIINDGPIPPKVGKETEFTIHWQALNLSNDVRDVDVKMMLPKGVAFTRKIIPVDANIKADWNGSNMQVVWHVGDLLANTGIISPVPEVIFQVSAVPDNSDIGNYMMLTGKTEITGTDNFTGVPLSTIHEEITTRLFSDFSIGPEEGKVVP